MVLSLSLGAFAGEVSRGMRGITPSWRERLLWLSTPEAHRALLFAFASAAMAIGILATQSRSGAAVMVSAFMVVALWSSRRQPTAMRRWAMASSLLVIVAVVMVYNGAAVARRITEFQGLASRVSIWRDTMRMARDFWLTGTGFNTYGAAMLHYQTVNDGFRYIEAHNDYLQLAAEGGLLVSIPFMVLVAAIVAEIRRRFRDGADDTRTYWLRAGAVTGIAAIALQSLLEFTLQMPGAAVMFATLLAIAIHHPPQRVGTGEARSR
jgi:O-antigen ligase